MKLMVSLVLVVVAACGDGVRLSLDAGADAPPPVPLATVAAGDFVAGHPGTLATVDLTSTIVTKNAAPAGAVGDNPVLRATDTELLIVNSADGNNITILGAHNHLLSAQLATGAGSNPQDVAVIGDKLYAPVYAGAGVAVLTRGSTAVATIDLSADDPDGHPECASNVVVGDKLYVACELLDQSFSPRGNGKVYVVDTTTDTVVQTITMATQNPFGLFRVLPSGDLLIPTVNFATNDGCIEKITTGATPASAGCIVTNATLGGYASRIDIQPQPGGGAIAWLAVTSFDFVHASLRSFDLGSGTLGAAITPPTQLVDDVAVCPDGTLAIADGTKDASGVRLYRNGVEVTTGPIAVGLDTKSANALVCY